mmetsp:Transcript_7347/g.15236  ORF Transcript_7347/g.15236 Transcript_7347/m.15236 type:complete len:218 (+) Transcript_7347:113-766(+)
MLLVRSHRRPRRSARRKQRSLVAPPSPAALGRPWLPRRWQQAPRRPPAARCLPMEARRRKRRQHHFCPQRRLVSLTQSSSSACSLCTAFGNAGRASGSTSKAHVTGPTRTSWSESSRFSSWTSTVPTTRRTCLTPPALLNTPRTTSTRQSASGRPCPSAPGEPVTMGTGTATDTERTVPRNCRLRRQLLPLVPTNRIMLAYDLAPLGMLHAWAQQHL